MPPILLATIMEDFQDPEGHCMPARTPRVIVCLLNDRPLPHGASDTSKGTVT